jgi:hypothetical protein
VILKRSTLPNICNVDSPITLLSYGRSGSSLLSKIFELHPDFSFVGETGNFIYDLWKGYEFSAGGLAPSIKDGRWVPDDERSGRMVRDVFLSCFPDDKKYWFHKPIGVPIALSLRINAGAFKEEEWDKAAVWYWNVINSSFPKAKFITILRHPFDVVLSSKSYWGYDEADIWWNYGLMSYLHLHPLSKIEYAISYDDMVTAPENTIRSLFEFIGVTFDKKVMDAFKTVHAAAKGREQIASNKLSRRNEWSQLDKRKINTKYLGIILSLFDKFNIKIELPSQISTEICHQYSERSTATTENELNEDVAIGKIISEQNKKIESIHSEYGKKMLENERKFYELYRTQQQWIETLSGAKDWLAEQNGNLVKQNEELQQWSRELQKANDWLAKQNEKLEQYTSNLQGELTRCVELMAEVKKAKVMRVLSKLGMLPKRLYE